MNSGEQSNNRQVSLDAFQKVFEKLAIGNNGGIKKHALMLFRTEKELGISDCEDSFINTENLYFTDGTLAIAEYLRNPCKYSQLVSGETIEELVDNMTQMEKNYLDKEWIELNVLQ